MKREGFVSEWRGCYLDVKEIEGVIDLYSNYIFSLSLRLTGHKEEAEDLYQTTFLKLYEKRDQVKENANIKAYLAGICIHLWRNEYRKRMRRHRILPLCHEEEAYLTAPDQKDIAKEVANNELKDELDHAINQLAERHKIPIILYYQMELSIAEIANIIKLPIGTVKSRLNTGRKKLKKSLEVNNIERYEAYRI